jgi:subfamily B ATP-binding cassette protein MsbA
MGDIPKIIRFGAPYLRRYWLRFSLGILFGFLFGVSNGLTIGAVKLMLNRLHDPNAPQVELAKPGASASAPAAPAGQPTAATQAIRSATKGIGAKAYGMLDAWMPRYHRPLDWKQITGGLLLFPFIAALRGAMGYGTSYCMSWAGQKISNDIKEDIFRKLTVFSLDFYHRHTTAELMSRLNDDTGALNACLRMGLSDLIKEPSTIVVLFSVLLYCDWKLTLLALVFAPLCVIPTRIISRRIKKQGTQDNVFYIQQAGVAMESFQNVRVTKAYDLANEQVRLYRRAGDRSSHFVMKGVQSRAMLNPIIETLNSFGMGAVLIYAIWGGITVETLGAFLVALVLFYQPFKKLSTVQVYFTQAGLAIGRLLTIVEEQPAVREPAHPREMAPFREALEFHDVSFSYGDGPVLEHIDVRIPRGLRLGLAGESGSGKSSLLNLLFRFYDPTGGRITLDGVSIDEFRLADLRGQMALVSQDVLLFNTTVAENIGYGKRGATREEIIQAAKEAHAHEFITELPKGYDTPLGERGQRLSGGQRQRIAIARAFIRNAPILVLDEATAALDSQSEAEVQKAIDHLVENRTVICVAHRLSTLRNMNRLLVLSRGKVVETGGFEELLARGGIFAGMAGRQGIRATAAVV